MAAKPVVATAIGDPCGIGPEVCVKALASGIPQRFSRPLLIGSADAVRLALGVSGIDRPLRVIGSVADATFEGDHLEVLDPGGLSRDDVTMGAPSRATGRAMLRWIEQAEAMSAAGEIDGWVMAPISTEGLKLAEAARSIDDLQPSGTYMFRTSGSLRNISLTEHIPISAVPGSVTKEAILEMLHILDAALGRWGVARASYAVAGLNPHAMGREEDEQIRPAVAAAQAEGLDVAGPLPPDSVFRQCLEGRYTAVLSMYHDQGQIALKTAAFLGACTIYLGLPYIRLTIPHGTAFDIAGKGIAHPESMIVAMCTAGSLAAGRGFPDADEILT